MPEVNVRKIQVTVEDIFHDGGALVDTRHQKAAALAVIENPFAGRYEPDIMPFMEDLKPLGLELSERLIAVLGGDPDIIDGYGKGGIVGSNGELEHVALWHVPGGYAMRERLGDEKAIVPSAKKMGGPGTRLDVPITHTKASYVRSHFDAMEVGLSDGPRPNELLYVIVMTIGGRVHQRVGGLKVSEIKGEDGLR